MIGACAVAAAMLELAVILWLLGECRFLIPYRTVILARYGHVLLTVAIVLFLNLFGVFYLLTRALLLKDTGRKLAHARKDWPPARWTDTAGDPWPVGAREPR